MHEDPDAAADGDEQVVPVAAALPVAARREGDGLQQHLHHEHQRQQRRRQRQPLRVARVPRPLRARRSTHTLTLVSLIPRLSFYEHMLFQLYRNHIKNDF